MRRLACAALLCGATLAAAQPKSDWERQYERRDQGEPEVTLPAPPKGGLLEFFVSSASSFKFFIDPQSLSVGPDGVVRYTLVARSRSGVENISYEGIRCSSFSFKIYALAHDSKWTRTQRDWATIERKRLQRWHEALALEYFCPNGAPVLSAAEALEYLRLGGHPDFRRHRQD